MTSFQASALQPSPAGASVLDRPLVYWGLAVLFLLFFLRFEVAVFQTLFDFSNLVADDGLRLQQVRDLLNGQPWFDTHQYRYLPPEGTLMHWSRLVDAPIAAGLYLLTPLLGQKQAELAVLAGWPLLLLAIYLALTVRTLMQTVGGRAAALSVVVAANLLVFHDLFSVGELDHHNVQTILILGAAVSFAFVQRGSLAPIVGGGCAALSLAVGLESLPFVAVIGTAYCLSWVADTRQARAFLLFAAALAATATLAFAAQTAPRLWTTPACDVLALPVLTLVWGALGLSCALVWSAPVLPSWRSRLAAAAGGGAVIVALCAAAFPACLEGPYHNVPESVRAEWLSRISEAFSFLQMMEKNPVTAFVVLGPPLVAAGAAWVGAMRTQGECRRLLLVVAPLLSLTVLLCLVQIRAIYIGAAFIPVAAGWALDRILASVTTAARTTGRAVALLVAGLFLFDTAWASVARVVQQLEAVPRSDPADRDLMQSCLADLPRLDALPPGVILAPLDMGAHILFLTHHSMISAGYHRNVEGILAQLVGLAGTEADMVDFVRRDAADYVVLCPPWIAEFPEQYGPFVKDLVDGASVSWLEPLALDSSLKAWRVKSDSLPPAS